MHRWVEIMVFSSSDENMYWENMIFTKGVTVERRSAVIENTDLKDIFVS